MEQAAPFDPFDFYDSFDSYDPYDVFDSFDFLLNRPHFITTKQLI
jgi:hypothetical protein